MATQKKKRNSPTKKELQSEEKVLQAQQAAINLNPHLPTVFASAFQVAVRESITWVSVLQGIPTIPNELCEQFRFVMTAEQTKRFIEVLCNQVKYFPKNPESSMESEKTKENPDH